MIFSISVHGHPASSQSANSAYKFARAALQMKHELHRVFFYHDAVHLADITRVNPQDEASLLNEWVTLATEAEVELSLCIAAGLKRGVLNEEERLRYDRLAANAHPDFKVVGLGQLIEAAMVSDRMITFGA